MGQYSISTPGMTNYESGTPERVNMVSKQVRRPKSCIPVSQTRAHRIQEQLSYDQRTGADCCFYNLSHDDQIV